MVLMLILFWRAGVVVEVHTGGTYWLTGSAVVTDVVLNILEALKSWICGSEEGD